MAGVVWPHPGVYVLWTGHRFGTLQLAVCGAAAGWRISLSIPGVITAAVLSFAHTLGEFGVVLMVGGNIPGVTRTVSIDIYAHVESLEYAAANRMAIALLLISFAVLSTIYAVNRRVWSPWPVK